MPSMKIENYTDSNAYAADTFTFPYNPYTFDSDLVTNKELFNIQFGKYHIYNTLEGINPKSLVLTGTFSGSDRLTNFDLLAKHIVEAKLKKVFFQSDRFYLALGRQIKQTNGQGRSNFTDYVCSFDCPYGLVMSDTQKNDTYTYATSLWTDGTKTNAGTANAYIEKVVVTLANGGGASDVFQVQDNHNNGIKVTLTTYSAAETLTIYFVTLITNIKVKSTKYWYCYQSTSPGTERAREITTGDYRLDLTLAPAEAISTLSFTGTTAKYSTIKVYWRDTYYS